MKPHKHAELIKAWADGAQIQVYTNTWNDDLHPLWRPNLDYRIKPEEKKPVVRWLWAKYYAGEWMLCNFLSDDEALKKFSGVYKKIDWSRTEFPE